MWSYWCSDDNVNITADTKDQLVDKVMQHVSAQHQANMTREEARQSVDQNAREI